MIRKLYLREKPEMFIELGLSVDKPLCCKEGEQGAVVDNLLQSTAGIVAKSEASTTSGRNGLLCIR